MKLRSKTVMKKSNKKHNKNIKGDKHKKTKIYGITNLKDLKPVL